MIVETAVPTSLVETTTSAITDVPTMIVGTVVPTIIAGTQVSIKLVPTTFVGTVVSSSLVGTWRKALFQLGLLKHIYWSI